MSGETTFRKYVADKINGHVSQIESHATSAGVPDTNYCLFNGVEGWIECKYSKNGKSFDVRGTQKTWIRRRLRVNHKRIYLFLRIEPKGGGREHILIHLQSEEQAKPLFDNPRPSYWKLCATKVWGAYIDENELYDLLGGNDGQHQ